MTNFAPICFNKQMDEQYPSLLLQRAVAEFAKLPGIGTKTAMRLVLHLLRQDTKEVESFGQAIVQLKREVRYCHECHNIADADLCRVCADPRRDHSTLCVVENVQDVMAVERTNQYKGVYHVLGGVISPIDGIGPSDLHIQDLPDRVRKSRVAEVILALSPTMEGDTTNFYIWRKLQNTRVKITTIARGVPQNDELQYADQDTLARSLANRVPFTAKT